MASVKGREKSRTRFVVSRRAMAIRAQPKRIAKVVAAENQRQNRHIPGTFNPLEIQRGEFLAGVLVSPELQAAREQGVRSFGIVWKPYSLIANGPHIDPFAHIFDRFVHGCWTVRVVDDIDGLGNPGWMFERG
jgi:hypothetical protein